MSEKSYDEISLPDELDQLPELSDGDEEQYLNEDKVGYIQHACSLKFPKFEEIPVSTKTFIIATNLTIDMQKLFDILPVQEYKVIPKKRGRKKKNVVVDPNVNIPEGSIITLDLAGNIRGVVLKKKKKKGGKKRTPFRNAMTIVMIIEGKRINFKISRNGKIQMTGCKFDNHAVKCVKYIWNYIKDTDTYTLPPDEYFSALFVPAMRNIDFSLGFTIDREKLDEYFNTQTEYHSLLDPSIGYTGVNIKIPITEDLCTLKIKQIVWITEQEEYKDFMVSYQKYLDFLTPKERQKKLEKVKYNTFLVFHSGNVIMSSMCEKFARNRYYEFLDIIRNNCEDFQERLED